MAGAFWTDEEVEVLKRCLRAGMTPAEATEVLPDRTYNGVANKITWLRTTCHIEEITPPEPNINWEVLEKREAECEELRSSQTRTLGVISV